MSVRIVSTKLRIVLPRGGNVSAVIVSQRQGLLQGNLCCLTFCISRSKLAGLNSDCLTNTSRPCKVLLSKSPDQLNQNLLGTGHWQIFFFLKLPRVIVLFGLRLAFAKLAIKLDT